MSVASITGPDGVVLTKDKMDKIKKTYAAVLKCPEELRAYVMCWFCEACYRHIPPGDDCNCLRDE